MSQVRRNILYIFSIANCNRSERIRTSNAMRGLVILRARSDWASINVTAGHTLHQFEWRDKRMTRNHCIQRWILYLEIKISSMVMKCESDVRFPNRTLVRDLFLAGVALSLIGGEVGGSWSAACSISFCLIRLSVCARRLVNSCNYLIPSSHQYPGWVK